MRQISLTKGQFVIVDDEDYPWLTMRVWQLSNRYAICWHVGRVMTMQEMLMGKIEGRVIEFINGNGLDCRRCNLQHSTRSAIARKRPRPIWEQVQAVAAEYRQRNAVLATGDLLSALSISHNTAHRYLDRLVKAQPDFWQWARKAPDGRGRPQIAIQPKGARL